MEKVNGCPKDIGLKNIFKNILSEKKKIILNDKHLRKIGQKV